MIILASSVSAWTNTTLNNSLSEENLIFIGNENITRWLSIPSDVTLITEAYLNLSGYEYLNYMNSIFKVYF